MGILQPINFGNPSFIGGKVSCISEIELWVNRYQFIEGNQLICYQPQGGAVVCVEGDSCNISQDYNLINENVYRLVYRTKNTLGVSPDTWSGWLFLPHSPQAPYQVMPTFTYPFSGAFVKVGIQLIAPNLPGYPNPYVSTNEIGIWYNDGTPIIYELKPLNPDYSEVGKIYKIEIFKEGQKVHEHTSNNPIFAWTETTPNKCIEGNWEKVSSWVQLPFADILKVQRLGNVYWFWLQRGLITAPVAIVKKNNDCRMPLYKLIVKPKWGCESKPECPPETVTSFNCNGFLCCYDKCGNLIKSIKL